MVRKPDWLKNLELSEISAKAAQDRASERPVSDQRLLRENVSKLWERVVARMKDVADTSQLATIKLTFARPETNLANFSVFLDTSPNPKHTVDVKFDPQTLKITRNATIGNSEHRELSFTLSSARVSLSDGPYPLPDDEEHDVAELAVQLLLEPLISPLVNPLLQFSD